MQGYVKATVKFHPEAARIEVDKADVHLFNLAQELRDTILQSFIEPKHGRTYYKELAVAPGVKRTTKREYKEHIASAPGEPPARLTGALGESIQVARTSRLAWAVSAGGGGVSGIAVKYARDLEFGTDRVAPRPYMRPAAVKVAKRHGVAYKVT